MLLVSLAPFERSAATEALLPKFVDSVLGVTLQGLAGLAFGSGGFCGLSLLIAISVNVFSLTCLTSPAVEHGIEGAHHFFLGGVGHESLLVFSV